MMISTNFAALLMLSIIGSAVGTAGIKRKSLGLCQLGCEMDLDCKKGLMCSEKHRLGLILSGYHRVKANCGAGDPKDKYVDVCFDPKILKTKGGAGGDPHFRTYDGTKYSYHGQCDLVMARSAAFGDGLGLDIHARTKIVDNWSLISNAAIRVGKDIFEVQNDGSYYLNGVKNINLPAKMEEKYEVNMVSGTTENATEIFFNFELGNDERITFSLFKSMISVRVDTALEDTEGMLGRQGKVGMIGRDQETVLVDPNEMGTQWQVTDGEPMLFHDIQAPQYPAQCELPKVTSRRLTKYSDEAMDAAKRACSNIDDADMQHFCIEDVLRTGDYELGRSSGYSF